MARFSETLLIDPSGTPTSGAVLYLTEVARESAVQQLDTGVEVEVVAGRRAAVVREGQETAHERARDAALEAVQHGLDLLCVRGVASLAIADPGVEHAVWWVEQGDVLLRIWSGTRMTIRSGIPTLVVHDAEGQIVPPPPEPRTWDDSFRYFRHAQITNDLFDAFRNLYLALESVLSAIAPMHLRNSGVPREREGDWFKRALTVAGQRVPLGPYTVSGTSADPVQDLFDEFYRDLRTAVFHAKAGRRVMQPYDPSSRSSVLGGLDRLGRLYLSLVEYKFGMRFATGGMTTYAFKSMADSFSQMKLYLSDDEAPVDKRDTSLNPSGGRLVELPVERAPEADDTWVIAWKASIEVGELGGQLGWISRVVASSPDGEPWIAESLEGRLDPDGFKRVEVLLGLEGYNSRKIRTYYLS